MLWVTLMVAGCCVRLSSQTSEVLFTPPPPPYEVTSEVSGQEEQCFELPETGACRAAIPMYYYDSMSHSCESFIWGGCPGSQNKFRTKESCMRACKPDVCRLPAVTGPCRANIRMWYFDAEHGRCNEFSYGGCDGNENQFPTEQQCLTACGGSSAPCEMGERYETVGYHPVTTNHRHTEWFTITCERRCRQQCSSDQPWGTCMAFAIERKWYKCNCFLFDRFLSAEEMDTGAKGITRNRQCVFEPETTKKAKKSLGKP